VAVYEQYDGYPDGVGLQLAGFLRSRRLCNGFPLQVPESPATHWANGVSCLAAQFIAEFKKEAGGLYLFHPDEAEEQWTYEVDAADNRPMTVAVINSHQEQFRGDVEQFAEFCDKKS
jgi:hypothetical protein